MTIYQFLKILSSKSKAMIIVHLYTCKCNHNCVNDIAKLCQISQSNLSKHLMMLRDLEIVNFVKSKKQIHYFLNDSIVKPYTNILDLIIDSDPMLKTAFCQNCHLGAQNGNEKHSPTPL